MHINGTSRKGSSIDLETVFQPFCIVPKCTHLGTQRNGTIFMKCYGYHRTSIKERHLDQGIADVYANLIWVIWFIKK
jgi:hypothetical protein